MKNFAQRISSQSRWKKNSQRQQEHTVTTRIVNDSEVIFRQALNMAQQSLNRQQILVTSGKNLTKQAVI